MLRAYDQPTAVVTAEIMSVVAEEIEDSAEAIQESEVFQEILNVIIDVQEELENATRRTCRGGAENGNTCTNDADCPGGTCGDPDLVLGGACVGGSNDDGDCASNDDCPDGGTCAGGVTLPTPSGAIQIEYTCPGWDERQFEEGDDAQPDPANGRIDLFMTLEQGGIGRVVWGEAVQCRYLIPIEGNDCEAAGCSEGSYDGGIALDLGPDWVGEDVSEIPVTFVVEGNIGLDGDDFRINQSFRVVLAIESGLVLLVDLADPALSSTFNYIFAETFQCIRDATAPDSPCSFGCSLEERRCFDRDGNTLFEW